jgi:hypothetical protein
LLTGAAHVTVACRSPGAAVTLVGAPGGPVGLTVLDGADAEPVPIAFVAVTVKVYAVPLVSPVTVAVRAPVVLDVNPPGEDVTV